MSLSIGDFLKTVRTYRYQQALGVEQYPTYIVDGVPQGWNSVLYVGKFTEQEFIFEGVPASIANNLPATPTDVTDASDNNYTVSFVDKVTVVGTNLIERLSNRVSKENTSPHLWRIVVRHKEGAVVS